MRRDGRVREVSIHEIAVGDVLVVEAGDKVRLKDGMDGWMIWMDGRMIPIILKKLKMEIECTFRCTNLDTTQMKMNATGGGGRRAPRVLRRDGQRILSHGSVLYYIACIDVCVYTNL